MLPRNAFNLLFPQVFPIIPIVTGRSGYIHGVKDTPMPAIKEVIILNIILELH